MKTLFKIEVMKSEYQFRRDYAIEVYKTLKNMRTATAVFFRAEKNTDKNIRLTQVRSYAAENVQRVKRAFKDEMLKQITRVMVVRVGRLNENVSEVIPVGMSYAKRKTLLTNLRNKVRDMRRRTRYFDDPLASRIPGAILSRHMATIFNKTKAPKDDAEYVGIEIECILPSDANMGALLPFAKYVNVGTDGSIACNDGDGDDGGEEGKEIRVCMKREEVRAVVPGIMAALNSMGARVNKSCGLHVHLDQRNNATPELTFQKLVRSLGLLFTVVPKSRRENTYCKRNRRTAFTSHDRYKAINSCAYRRYRTIEVRLFGGTLNADKVINWIEVLEAISHGEMVNRCPKNFDTARKYWTALTDANVAWLKERQARFTPLNSSAPVAESGDDQRIQDGLEYARDNADDDAERSDADLSEVA